MLQESGLSNLHVTSLVSYLIPHILVVGPVLKIKTGFRGFETKQNLGKFTEFFYKKFYASVHELYYQ